ncbi:MAG: SAP domain-containing protein [Candidatus Poseidoniaceae archaeon]|nr:SAP domain-containing protein [Candidatus Poseidoniaceae archaeon]
MVKSSLSQHTVAELRKLCKRNGLVISGKKSALIERLQEAGFGEKVEPQKSQTRIEELRTEMGDEDALILEEDEPRTPREKKSLKDKTSEKDKENEIADDEVIDAEVFDGEIVEAEIFEAEVLEAEVVTGEEDEEDESTEESENVMEDPIPIPVISKSTTRAKNQLGKTPPKRKIVAGAVVFFLLAMTGWWYFSGTIEPFTPDPIRYGDSMHYTISDGLFSADGEYVEKTLEALNSEEDDICKIALSFSGTGDISITKGGEAELSGETGDEMLGAVKQRGSYGYEWLTVEKDFSQDYNDVIITRHKNNLIDSSKCNDSGASAFGNTMSIQTKTWNEMRSEDLLRSQVDYQVQLESSSFEGSLTTFGLSGIFSSLGSLQSSISMAFAPIELKELIGDTLVEDGSSGTRMGWEWRVVGSEEKNGDLSWRIFMESSDIKKYCLGHAHITIWAQAESPWAVHQEVDIQIDGDDKSNTCDSTSQIINDLVVPEGTLEMRMKMQRSSIERGEKAVVFGRDYDSRPRSSDFRPNADELSDWGENGTNLPDLSSRRTHPLESAVDCVPHLEGAAGAKAALAGEGYVWRAVDNRSVAGITNWNLSWVDSDDISGWVNLDVSGSPASSENCTYIGSGSYEDGPSHDRNDIPESLDLAALESRFLDAGKYPELTSGNAYLGTSSAMHDNVRYGHLITTAGAGFDRISQWFDLEDGAGASTVDLHRTWEDGQWTNSFKLGADASDGRVVGWSFARSM